MNKLIFLCAKFLFILFAIVVHAQPGANDPTFNTDDLGFGIGDGANEFIYTVATQNDGKVLIGGHFTLYDNVAMVRIARLNENGSIDTTFHVGGGANHVVRAIAVQSDGKILVGGYFETFNYTNKNFLVRLNPNGSIDGTFNIGNVGPGYYVHVIRIQNDGKILIGGELNYYNGAPTNGIARLNPDGSLDTTFNINNGFGWGSDVDDIAIQSDGKLLIGGSFSSFNGLTRSGILRLNEDGTLDSTFNSGPGLNGSVYSIAIQNDNKIILGGGFTTYNGANRLNVLRLNADASLDSSFVVYPTNFIHAVKIQSDGKIIIGGNFYTCSSQTRLGLARLHIDGAVDLSFDPSGGATTYTREVRAVAILPDDKILVGGYFFVFGGAFRTCLARLHVNAANDYSFASRTGLNNTVHSTSIQSDGKIIVAGNFITVNDKKNVLIARLNRNGSLDSTFNFNQNLYLIGKSIFATKILDDGKILIGGNTSFGNSPYTVDFFARLDTSGTYDLNFNNFYNYIGGSIHAFAISNDLKILVGGILNVSDPSPLNLLKVDPVYVQNVSSYNFDDNYKIYGISVQTDGKILFGIGNKFYRKILSSGYNDPSFANVNIYGNGQAYQNVIQNDGKIIVVGAFVYVNGVPHKNIFRLNSNGTIDQTYNTGLAANDTIYTVVLQQDGKAIIGGKFTSYNGIPAKRIARINTDGSLDTSFNPSGAGANNAVRTISIQADDHLIIGGDFTSYNGVGRNRIARICVTDAYASNSSSVMCLNSQSTLITHTTLGATDIGTAIGLPPGVTASWSQDTIKITGTPTATGTFNYSIPLISTCGSVTATGTITVALNSAGTDVVTACDNFTWIDSINYSSNTNSATFHLLNHAGCDSLVSLNLTILSSIENMQSFQECPGFSINVGSNAYDSTGVYNDVFVSSNGCDSIVITNLNIFDTDTTQTLSACAGYSVTVGANTYNTSGVYSDVLQSIHGCDSTIVTYLTIDSIDVSVSLVSNELIANQLGVSYQWLNCDSGFVEILNATTQNFTPLHDGNYAVKITSGACIDTSSCYSFIVTGISKLHSKMPSLAIYPNPGNGIFNLSFENFSYPNFPENYTLKVFNSIGILVYETLIKKADTILDMSKQANGIYMVQICSKDGTFQKNIIKQ